MDQVQMIHDLAPKILYEKQDKQMHILIFKFIVL
jgi:hypothetical protein